jgi:hypothetical protein
MKKMGTFFATHEAELYHYGRKGMRRGRHLPDVLDPTRALVGTRASSGEALTTRFYDRYRKDKASRQAVRNGRESLRGTLSNNKSYNPKKVNAERDDYEAIKKYVTGKHFALRKRDRKSTEETSSDTIKKPKGLNKRIIESTFGAHKTAHDYAVENNSHHRTVAQRQEEAKREAERNAAKNAIARGYATKIASRTAASGAATGNAVRELNRQVGQERLRRSARGASIGNSRSAYENDRTERAVNAQKQRVARAAERYNSNLGNVSGGAQQARKKSEDARTQNSRTKKLQKEARETRERNGEIRRILDYNARVWRPKYLSEEAQTRSAKVIRDKENRKTQESKKQFSNMPKWKQNLERAKSQKAASENAERARRKKQYAESQRHRHLEENRGRKSKRPY